MTKKVTHDTIWAGSEATYDQYLEASEGIKAALSDGRQPPASSSLLSVEGDIGIIGIRGPMTNSRSIFDSLFGLVSYGAIQEAIIEAVSDPDIKHIVLDIDSGGGAVRGVEDTASMIRQAAQFKPVHAYSGGAMCSAAYWLGTSAGTIHASKTAEIGSIGVIMTHMEYSRALENQGVKATVIRSGPYKQVGNPYEALSDEGKAELQSMVDGINKIFVEHVAESRKRSYDYTNKQMGQGRVFLANDAHEIGLIDGISSFEELLIAISSKTIDKNKKTFENKHIGANMANNNKKTVLSAAVHAALVQAGTISADTNLESLGFEAEGTPDVTGTEVPETRTADASAQEDGDKNTTENADLASMVDTNDVSGTGVVEASEVADLKAEVRVYKGQLAEANTSLVAAQAATAAAESRVTELEALTQDMAAIVATSVNAMSVALGASKRDLSAMSATEVVAMHKQLSSDFQAKFKAGGVAVATATDTGETRQKNEPIAGIDLARIKATSL